MKSRFGTGVALVAAAALFVAGCTAETERSAAPPQEQHSSEQQLAPEPPNESQWRVLERDSLVGFIHDKFVATSWDPDEQLLMDTISAHGYRGEGYADFGLDLTDTQTLTSKIDSWVNEGAAAIIIESTLWEDLGDSVQQAREAGVRVISYLKPAPESIEIDAHVGVESETYQRAQLKQLVSMLQVKGAAKPWRIASVSHHSAVGLPTDVAVEERIIDELVTDGTLTASDDIELLTFEWEKHDNRNTSKKLGRWLGKQEGIDGAIFSDSTTLRTMRRLEHLSPTLPVVSGEAMTGHGPDLETAEMIARNRHYAAVFVPASVQVDLVVDVLDAFRDGTDSSLDRLKRDGVPTELPVAVPEPVTLTRDSYRELVDRFPNDLMYVQHIFDEWVTGK